MLLGVTLKQRGNEKIQVRARWNDSVRSEDELCTPPRRDQRCRGLISLKLGLTNPFCAAVGRLVVLHHEEAGRVSDTCVYNLTLIELGVRN